MHDLPLTQRIAQMVMKCISDARAQPDTDLFLVIGLRCTSQSQTTQFRWDVVRRGALADEAQRHFDRSLFKLMCPDCGFSFDLMESSPICPICGGLSASAVGAEGCGVEVIKTD